MLRTTSFLAISVKIHFIVDNDHPLQLTGFITRPRVAFSMVWSHRVVSNAPAYHSWF
jgi:hypothetical protein